MRRLEDHETPRTSSHMPAPRIVAADKAMTDRRHAGRLTEDLPPENRSLGRQPAGPVYFKRKRLIYRPAGAHYTTAQQTGNVTQALCAGIRP
ncbi:hypothetical protein [Thioclava sp. GXIMD4216]|uniref:hypothetical protein n=1 Tax=Thioclava sp. GXIMD4216 TaxID=3131929 RepID=UPI0030CB643F